MTGSSENIVNLHNVRDSHNHNEQALSAIAIMRKRKNINDIKDPEKRVVLLVEWRLEAEKYWSEYC